MRSEKAYWFPAKRFGLGWGFPVTWQGWATFIAWFGVVVGAGLRFMPASPFAFLTIVAVATALLLFVCYLKGAPAGWRWGGDPS